jgi:segregation and condensation protein A
MQEKVPWWRWAFEIALSGIRSGFGLFRHNGRVEVNGKVEIAPETNVEAFVAEPESSFEHGSSPEPKIVEVESNTEMPAEPESGSEPENTEMELRAENGAQPESSPEREKRRSEVESNAEEPAEAESEIVTLNVTASAAGEDPESGIALSMHPAPAEVALAEVAAAEDAPSELEAPEEEIALTKTSPQPDERATGPEQEAAPALLPEPVPPAKVAPASISSPAAQSAPPQDPTLSLPFDPPLAAKPAPEPTTAEKVAAALKARGVDAEQSPFSVFVGQVYDGPLDLLLDLIRKQDINIYDIPIAKITAQFLAYVDHLRASDMDVAGEFIYTAALLIHIKSKMLLPRAPVGPEESAEDPRRELVDRLLEHERFRNAAQMLHDKQMLEANTWTNPGVREFREDAGAEPEIAADTTDLVRIFRDILERARNRPIINVEEDSVTVGQMIQFLTRRLTMEDKPVALRRLLSHTHSERALIAMFLGLLELVRLQAILLRQDRQFSEIFVKKNTGFDAVMNEGLANARDDWR